MLATTYDIEFLETRVNGRSAEVGIKPEIWALFREVLDGLKDHNEFMYTHSLRVGIYASGIAEFEGQTNLKFPLFAGCGHDIGKCEVENAFLDSKNLQPHEFEQIKKHSIEGFEKLKDSFLFTGLIAGLHHKYKDGGYGIDLDVDPPYKLDEEAKATVKAMAQLVMIADFFDALTTRNNDKGFIKDPNDKTEQRTVMLKYFPESERRISWLIEHRIR
jgi:HD-GYP domain-containing protein (c-di-GMP phosphodiesterase class II)